MPKVTLYNTAGAAAGEIELNDSVFGVEYNEAVTGAGADRTPRAA